VLTPSNRQMIGVPPSTASVSDSTLIIIDAQNEYADGNMATEDVASTRAAIGSLLSKYRAGPHGGKNIVHVLHDAPQGAPIFTPDTPLAAEFAELEAKAGEKVVHKSAVSSFAGTDLKEYLDGLGEVGKKVVLVGYMAHVCVSTTARAASDMGLDVILAADGIGDRDIPGGFGGKQLTGIVLRELGDAFGTVVQGVEVK
jgi:nicotinamidase-related amidase